MDLASLKSALENIELEDLEFVEQDLSFNELASLAFLLYGEEKTNAQLALQKLLIISNVQNANQGNSFVPTVSVNLLHTYASKLNPSNWRASVIEALSVINARRVLRKLGFKWETVRQHYLPHISELSLHLHPLLKALYKICDNLTPAEAGRLIIHINEHHRPPQEHFRFYNSEILEVFILEWITRRIISVGDHEGNGANLQVLFEYFKLKELDDVKSILVNTLKHSVGQNAEDTNAITDTNAVQVASNTSSTTIVEPSTTTEAQLNGKVHQEIDENINDDCYQLNYESVGIVLIINERDFYAETNEDLQHLLPKEKLKVRQGTDVDKDKLIETFTSYGYKPIVKDNLKHTEILEIISDCAKRSIFYNSFIVCILSHGFDGHVYGSNSIPISIDEIEEKFTTEELEDKPKVLIIQACQTKNAEMNETEKKKRSAIKYADILKAMATVPGFVSLRHTNDGSWFIQSLCKAITRLSHKKHLLDILTAVTGEVSAQKGKEANQVMVPQLSSTLRRELRFPARKTT